MKKIIFTSAMVSTLFLTSCATIISGSKQTVKFDSTPQAATILINEVKMGETPFETKLKRNQEHDVVIKLDGYKPYQLTLTKKFNAWYIGNVAFGGLIGLIIDPVTGAMYKLSPKEINAKLDNGMAFKNEGGAINIAVSLEIDPAWQKVAQLEKL